MTAHKHADMIKAMADNMELIVFYRDPSNGKWKKMKNNYNSIPEISGDIDYFLCLPKHADAYLHWQNGGDILVSDHTKKQVEIQNIGEVTKWGLDSVFMLDKYTIEIIPRKEKRLIAYDAKTGTCYTVEPGMVPGEEFQVIEVEVRV